VKQLQGSGALFAGAAVVLMAAQPVWAQSAAQVTAVRINPTERGFNVVLETSTGRPPQIITSRQGNALVADIINTQLRLPQENNSFRQDNPAPGIASVIVAQFKPNSIRMIVTGSASSPEGQIAQRDGKGITLSVTPSSTAPVAQTPGVLVPNPKITIDGVPATGTVPPATPPPFLPRAVSPPVGDIAVSNTDSSPTAIDLGSNERVPRLVLRDAPVREVLALLARAAGLNLAFTAGGAAGAQAQPDQAAAAASPEGPRISLDIENESVQNVFNYVLQLSGLQANRRGNTVFVGARLSNQARDVIVRSLRLNQVTVGVALNFLVGMGAESAVSRERTVTSVNAVPVGGTATPVTQTQTSTETRIETQRIDFQDSLPLLRGLQVLGDERTNSVTLVGTPKQIDIATAQLIQLDARRRQVAVNVKIVDVTLTARDQANTSFSFAIGDSFFRGVEGVGSAFFGRGGPNPIANGSGNRQFLAQLQASVQNGNGKILTDPTLTVQEGQTAVVNLTSEVYGGLRLVTQGGDNANLTTQTQEPIIKQAGLILQIRIDRVDDNGFVALSVAPTVSAIGNPVSVPGQGDISLLNSRQLSTGQIRLRDGQTLILSGIIQESDTVAVTKLPILGDIPILGALFRRTERNNTRNEVIVLLTPQILDDSERSSAGYNYSPGPAVRQMLERRGLQLPSGNR